MALYWRNGPFRKESKKESNTNANKIADPNISFNLNCMITSNATTG